MSINDLEYLIEKWLKTEYMEGRADAAIKVHASTYNCKPVLTNIMDAVKSYMASVIGEFEIETDEAAYQRNNLKYEQRIRAGLSQPAKEDTATSKAAGMPSFSKTQPAKNEKEESTSRKCPNCKSSNFYDRDGFLWECTDCGHIWNEDDEQPATRHGEEGKA